MFPFAGSTDARDGSRQRPLGGDIAPLGTYALEIPLIIQLYTAIQVGLWRISGENLILT